MLKIGEVKSIITEALLELDNTISDKPNEDGSYDFYNVDVIEDNAGLILTFQTNLDNNRIDKYRITISNL